MSPFTRTIRGDRGAAAVELAFVLPMLMLLVLGIADFALAFNRHIALSGGAREGARVAAINIPGFDPAEVTRDAAPSIPSEEIVVAVTACPSPPDPTAYAEVTASTPYSFHFINPLLEGFSAWFGGSALSDVTLTGIGVMRCGG